MVGPDPPLTRHSRHQRNQMLINIGASTPHRGILVGVQKRVLPPTRVHHRHQACETSYASIYA